MIKAAPILALITMLFSAEGVLAGKKYKTKDKAMDWADQTDEFWKNKLSSEAYQVCRKGGTERAFTGEYNSYKKDGIYECSSCGQDLFRSNEKFDSGTGWPSYWAPLDKGNIEEHQDTSHGMVRTEIKCSRCKAHLGHVFEDGPPPTGKRYCINSVCLLFKDKK